MSEEISITVQVPEERHLAGATRRALKAYRDQKRRAIVSELILLRLTAEEIQGKLIELGFDDCKISTVRGDIYRLRQTWKEASKDNIQALTERELAKLDMLERVAYDGLEKVRNNPLASEERDKYIQQILKIHDRRADLLGLKAPKRVTHAGDPTKPILHRVTALQDHELEAIAAGVAEVQNHQLPSGEEVPVIINADAEAHASDATPDEELKKLAAEEEDECGDSEVVCTDQQPVSGLREADTPEVGETGSSI